MKKAVEVQQKMKIARNPNTEVVNGVTFELRPFSRQLSNPEWVCLRKPRRFVSRYRAMAPEFQGCNMVEVGIDQGGSTSFFSKLFQPKALLAIDLANIPLPELTKFLDEHDEERRVKVHLGVDQADHVVVPRLVEDLFGNQPLDIVIDDASHLLDPTTATFEMLFPRLRRGGLYVIEDWTGDHMMERQLNLEVAANPDGELAARIAAVQDYEHRMPTSFLICQLLVAAARNPDWVAGIHATAGIVEIRRGNVDIEPGTAISSYLGDVGRLMFDRLKV